MLYSSTTLLHTSVNIDRTQQGECQSSSKDGFSAPCLLLILKCLNNSFETSRKWSVSEVYSCSSSQTDKSLQHCMNAELEQRFRGHRDQSDQDQSAQEQSHWDSHEQDWDQSCQSSESEELGSSSNNDDEDEDASQVKKQCSVAITPDEIRSVCVNDAIPTSLNLHPANGFSWRNWRLKSTTGAMRRNATKKWEVTNEKSYATSNAENNKLSKGSK